MEKFLSWSLYTGRVAGIRIHLHWALLIWWLFQLTRLNETGFTLWIWLMNVVITFGCILLHEFGHCFAARSVGGSADHILLWPLGGLATCETPHHPRALFAVAGGGPLVTAILIVLAYGVSYIFPEFSASSSSYTLRAAYETLTGWQLAILIFNLIPIYPMDGGRMFHSGLWLWLQNHGKRFDSYQRSSLITIWVSRITAGAGVVIGLLMQNTIIVLIFIWCFSGIESLKHSAVGYGVFGDQPDYGRAPERDSTSWFSRLFKRTKSGRNEPDDPIPFPVSAQRERERADEILDKINKKGMKSLTKEELSFMKEYSRKMSVRNGSL